MLRKSYIFNEAIERDQTDFWSYYGLGWCWARGNVDVQEAIKFTAQALNLRPDFATARYNLACHKAELNDAKGSVEELTRLLEPTRHRLQILGIERDDDFKGISNSKEFESFMKLLGLTYQFGNNKQ